jgi:toxin HigB-1
MTAGNDDEVPEGPDENPAQPLYRDKRTARFANGERVREFQAFEEQAKKRLLILNAAVSRQGLMLLPSNRFEALGGDRKGQFSIRINQQWRICFEWPEQSPRSLSDLRILLFNRRSQVTKIGYCSQSNGSKVPLISLNS